MKNALNFGFVRDIQREQQQTAQAALVAAEAAKAAAEAATVNHFDSAAGDAAEAVLALDDQAFNSELLTIRREALFATFQLSDDILTDDLDDDEIPSDRLDAYVRGQDDPEDDDEENAQLEQQVMQIKAANMADAMASLGVSDDVIVQAFDTDVDDADEAIEKIAEIIEANTPTGEDLNDFIQAFLFGDPEINMNAGEVEVYDSAALGKNKVRKTKSGQTLVYKGVKAVRNGKITVVNKRVGNSSMKVKLSPKQKSALRKAQAKAVTPNALKRRVKSLRIGMKNGIYKSNKGL